MIIRMLELQHIQKKIRGNLRCMVSMWQQIVIKQLSAKVWNFGTTLVDGLANIIMRMV